MNRKQYIEIITSIRKLFPLPFNILDKINYVIASKIAETRFLNSKFNQDDYKYIFRKSNQKKELIDLFTISFNNLETIVTQNKRLKKFLKDKYFYFVTDNSTNNQIASDIENFCKKEKIPYFRLKNNPFNNPSRSHGIALNWAIHNIIAKRNSKYFGTLDHDIYPIRKTSLIKKINSKVWGRMQQKGDKWYLWPGFSFFDSENMDISTLNFMPAKGLDTGGSNWQHLYSKINRSQIEWPEQEYIKYKEGNEIQSSSIEIIGDWLHLINASGWKDGKVKGNIDDFIDGFLNKLKIKNI